MGEVSENLPKVAFEPLESLDEPDLKKVVEEELKEDERSL